MEGPYFPLTLLVPGSVDTLPTMVVVVAVYYFVASLAALKSRSRRDVLVVVALVVAVNTFGLLTWHDAQRSAGAHRRAAQHGVQAEDLCTSAAQGSGGR
jgi:hypothetical protein